VDNALRHGAGAVDLSARREGERIIFAVTDEGTGFDDDTLPRAFERFSRGRDNRHNGGSGLGLAIVATIARAHDGRASARNRPGAGAHAELSLPAGVGADVRP
jgi:signal transduction histidine kinase